MRLPIYLLLLAAAFVGTAAALRLALNTRNTAGVEYATGLSAGTFVVWLLVTISSFQVVTVSNGTEITNSYPGLAVVGVLGTAVSLVILAKGSLELLGD